MNQTMMQVLFVDDDMNLLVDLRTLLLMSGADWNIQLATDGLEALHYLENGVYDVVVADMQMPGIDGAELLSIVRDAYPQAMRILMTGNADIGYAARLVPHAHQILLKPCQPMLVRSVVERAYELGQRLSDPELKRVLGGITDLPRPPQSVLRLNALLDSADANIAEVVEVVEADMALTVKLFQLVNSAYYGLNRSVGEIREAIAYLGMNTVRNLAVSVEVTRSITATSVMHVEQIQQLQDRANAVAGIARQLVLGREAANEAFVAGLLHDVGLLAVMSYMPDRYEQLVTATERSGLPMWELEVDVIGANHSDLGAYLLNLWGLPYGVVEAVARHHDAPRLPHRKVDATHAVSVAEALVSSQLTGRTFRDSGEPSLDKKYLEELGLLERVAGLLAVGIGS